MLSFSLPHIIDCLIFLKITHRQAGNENGSPLPVPEVEYLINYQKRKRKRKSISDSGS